MGMRRTKAGDGVQASSAKAKLRARSTAKKPSKTNKLSSSMTGGGSFHSMGLHPSLLRAIHLRGFNTPTPIQRAVLPHILADPPRDVVGMARTGSGKTLAYLIPLIQSLGGSHSIKFGIRALIIVPTRELALQVLKVGKDLAKGFVQGTASASRSEETDLVSKLEALRWGLVVGGDSLEDQFATFASNPDVVIATPGRLLHLVVEMNLDLKSATFVVFDEADRLFEMGFATQLEETLHRLPANRQTLLFSATLPKNLVEFAKAGLQNPKLIRLDSESKISPDLQMAFLSVKPIEKEAGLLILLADVVGVPKADPTQIFEQESQNWVNSKSSPSSGPNSSTVRIKPTNQLASHQTIVFTATKHHVEYLGGLLVAAGYQVSSIYGALDQVARREQLDAFRTGRTNILVVTDLAARGIDIPILENVINYDFPSSARAFVHRVGRTARAGRKGWAYSLITQSELPFLMDLQLFLSRPLITCPISSNVDASSVNFSTNLVIGTLPRDRLDAEAEYAHEALISPNSSLIALSGVVKRAQKMYEKSQSNASNESYRRAKDFLSSGKGFGGTQNEEASTHLIFKTAQNQKAKSVTPSNLKSQSNSTLRDQLLAKVNQFTPCETVFEIGTRGKGVAAQIMRDRRKSMGQVIKRKKQPLETRDEERRVGQVQEDSGKKPPSKIGESTQLGTLPLVPATEVELEEAFEMPKKRKKIKQAENFRDQEVYLDYEQHGAAAEKGYSLNEGTSAEFVAQSKLALFDLGENDEGKLKSLSAAQKASQVKWDRKTKKFVKAGQVGADNIKLIKTENGMKLPASFKTGSFENWKRSQKIRIPNVGDQELERNPSSHPHRKFRHPEGAHHRPNQDNKSHDRDHVHQKNKQHKVFKKTVDGQKKFMGPSHLVTRGSSSSKNLKTKKSQFSGRPDKNLGLKSVDQIRKMRELKEKRKIRSNQPSRRRSKT